jgi:hypothetical protein
VKSLKCSNPKCNKVIGEMEYGKVRLKCKSCGTFTEIEIVNIKSTDIAPAPPRDLTATAYVGRLVSGH